MAQNPLLGKQSLVEAALAFSLFCSKRIALALTHHTMYRALSLYIYLCVI